MVQECAFKIGWKHPKFGRLRLYIFSGVTTSTISRGSSVILCFTPARAKKLTVLLLSIAQFDTAACRHAAGYTFPCRNMLIIFPASKLAACA